MAIKMNEVELCIQNWKDPQNVFLRKQIIQPYE